jgi:hypothetical protein
VSGKFAYSTRSWDENGANLWVYNYQNGESVAWFDNVRRAEWSPVFEPGTQRQALAVVFANNDLALATAPDHYETLENDVFPVISWSPDGKWLAFVKDNTLFIRSSENGEVRKLAEKVYYLHGWIGDRPIWAPEKQALIYQESPFKVVFMDGSGSFTPLTRSGEVPKGDRIFNMLWSDACSCLVGDTQDYDGNPILVVYQLSADMHTLLDTITIEGAKLAAWWVKGESVLLENGQILAITGLAPDATPTTTTTPTPVPCETFESSSIDPSKIPAKPLDQTSAESLLNRLKYALENQDLYVLCNLTRERINFGLDGAEYNYHYGRAEFIKELSHHLSNQTTCMAYTYREGEITTLTVFTYAWEPPWEYGDRISPGLILSFSDQGTKGRGLYLTAAAVPDLYYENSIDQLYDQRCP